MNRNPEVKDIITDGLLIEIANPIYNLVKQELDIYLLQKTLNENDINEEFYVDDRANEIPTGSHVLKLWKKTPDDVVTSYNAFRNKINNNGLVYLLIGRKGSGKTTILIHFKEESAADKHILNIYLDLKSKKSDKKFLSNFHDDIYELIYDKIMDSKLSSYFNDINFAKNINSFYKYLSNADLSKLLLTNKKDYVKNFLKYTKKTMDITIYLILDNIDDWPKEAVQTAIDVCGSSEFRSELGIRSVIALRDCWTTRSLNLSDYIYASIMLSNPNYFSIIKKRLDLAIPDSVDDKPQLIPLNDGGHIEVTPNDVKEIYLDLAKQITENRSLQTELFNLSNCNMREFLQYIFYFFHSVHLSTKSSYLHLISKKLLNKCYPDIEVVENRDVQFHDFIEHNMAIHSYCFDSKASLIFNLFYHKGYTYQFGDEYRASLIFIRILRNISRSAPTYKNQLIADLEECGYPKEAIQDAIKILVSTNLIESPDGVEVNDISEIYLSIKGEVYLKTVVYEFSYYLYLADVEPMENEYKTKVKEKYGEVPLGKGNLQKKIESVYKLISFLMKEEKLEGKNISQQAKNTLNRYRQGEFFEEILREIRDTINKKLLRSGTSDKAKKIENAVIQKLFIPHQ